MKLHRMVVTFWVLLVFSAISHVSAQEPVQLLGDLDGDGIVAIADIDVLCAAIGDREFDLAMDVDEDGTINYADLETVLESIGSRPADANLDGLVQFRDFVTYTSNFGLRPATWSDGDFACDGEVNFRDFLIVSVNYGEFRNEAQVADAIAAVPEPSSSTLAFVAPAVWLLLVRTKDNQRKCRRATGRSVPQPSASSLAVLTGVLLFATRRRRAVG